MNIFAAAKEKAADTKNAATASKHLEIEVHNNELQQNISRLAEVNQQLDSLDAEAKMLTSSIKQNAVNIFVDRYKKDNKNPGTFVLRAKGENHNASLMFIAKDQYIKIDQERYNTLKAQYGDSIVNEETTYVMDSALVEKYSSVLSKLIFESKEISPEDKENLIKAAVSYSVAKGTINKVQEYGDVAKVVEDVNPVYMMRNVKQEEK